MHNILVEFTVWRTKGGIWHKYTLVTHLRQSNGDPSTRAAMRDLVVSVGTQNDFIKLTAGVWPFEGEIQSK